MKIIDVLKFNRELINKLRKVGIRLEDAEYVDLYSDYTEMLGQGDKVSYVIAVLANKYGICERKVYALIKHFQTDCSAALSREKR